NRNYAQARTVLPPLAHSYAFAIERGTRFDPFSLKNDGGIMKQTALVGIVLIVLGIFALTYHGFTYTTRERVVDIGPIKIDSDKTKTVPLPPILGGLALAGGVILLLAGRRDI